MENLPLMEGVFAFCVGLLTAAGIYLALRGRTFPVVVGLTLLAYAVNLFLFSAGRLQVNGAAILGKTADYADPLPQALVLTAIVIGFAMTAFVVILAIRARADLGNDHVDGLSSSNSAPNEQKNHSHHSHQQNAEKSTNKPSGSSGDNPLPAAGTIKTDGADTSMRPSH